MDKFSTTRKSFPKLLNSVNSVQVISQMTSRRNTCMSPIVLTQKGRLLLSRDKIVELSRNEQR